MTRAPVQRARSCAPPHAPSTTEGSVAYLNAALDETRPLGVGAELVDELLHVRLLRRRGLVRPPLVLGELRPHVDEGVVVALVVVQLLGQEVDDVGRHLHGGGLYVTRFVGSHEGTSGGGTERETESEGKNTKKIGSRNVGPKQMIAWSQTNNLNYPHQDRLTSLHTPCRADCVEWG